MIEEMADVDMIGFSIISNVGTAKSLVMEALYAAKEGNFDLAEEKLKESKHYFVEGHKIHASLIQKEASGEDRDLTYLNPRRGSTFEFRDDFRISQRNDRDVQKIRQIIKN